MSLVVGIHTVSPSYPSLGSNEPYFTWLLHEIYDSDSTAKTITGTGS